MICHLQTMKGEFVIQQIEKRGSFLKWSMNGYQDNDNGERGRINKKNDYQNLVEWMAENSISTATLGCARDITIPFEKMNYIIQDIESSQTKILCKPIKHSSKFIVPLQLYLTF